MTTELNKSFWLVSMAAGLAGMVALTGCERPKQAAKAADPEAAPVAVSLVPVRQVKTPRVVTLSGTLIGNEQANVAAGAAGKVVATFVERGSFVKKGAVLAKLDARAVSAQAAQAAADVEALKIQASQSKLDCDA